MNNKQFTSKHISAFLLSAIIFLSFITPALAVSQAAVLFLLISPSPQANAMGQTYGNIVTTSPIATIFNPASLGFFAQKNYVGISYFPQKIGWLQTLASDMNYNARNTNIGINLINFTNIPLSFGVAFHHVRLNLGEQIIVGEHGPEPLGTFSSWDEVNGITFSIALDYYVKASFGYTTKSIESHLAPFGVGIEQGLIETEVDAHDIGFILEFPVYDILRKSNVIRDLQFRIIEPYLNPGFYYSKANIGDKIVYIDAAQADPLPRNLSLGINVNTGFTYRGKHSAFNIFSVKWAREVDDILIKDVKINEEYSYEYVSGLNDIKLWDNLFLGKSNDKIVTKRGYEFNLGDFYFIRNGKYEDIEGKVIFKTKGWGINYTQPVRILAALFNLDDNIIIRMIANINFEKHHSTYILDSGHPLFGTEYTSYVIRLNNFPLDELF